MKYWMYHTDRGSSAIVNIGRSIHDTLNAHRLSPTVNSSGKQCTQLRHTVDYSNCSPPQHGFGLQLPRNSFSKPSKPILTGFCNHVFRRGTRTVGNGLEVRMEDSGLPELFRRLGRFYPYSSDWARRQYRHFAKPHVGLLPYCGVFQSTGGSIRRSQTKMIMMMKRAESVHLRGNVSGTQTSGFVQKRNCGDTLVRPALDENGITLSRNALQVDPVSRWKSYIAPTILLTFRRRFIAALAP